MTSQINSNFLRLPGTAHGGGLHGQVTAFLTQADRAHLASTCRTLREAAWKMPSEEITLWHGALTPAEASTPDFNAAREYRELKRMQHLPKAMGEHSILVLDQGRVRVVEKNSQGFWANIAYYLGFTEYLDDRRDQVGNHFVEISNRRIAQINELLDQNAPETLIDFRNILFRVTGFIRESESMRTALAKDTKMLDKDTDELFCLARYVCKFVQWLLSLFFSTAYWETLDCTLSSNARKMYTKYTDIIKGAFKNTPKPPGFDSAEVLGICISKFPMVRWDEEKQRQTPRSIGVYAFPRWYTRGLSEEPLYTGETVFILSEDGRNRLGDVPIHYVWTPKKGVLSVGEGSLIDLDRLPLRRSGLQIGSSSLSVLAGADDADREASGDRPVMRALMQLSVELLAKHGEKRLQYNSIYDHAHVLLSGGAMIDDKRSGKEIAKDIWERVCEAREKGRKFPEYMDESGILMSLENAAKRSVLDVKVDFGSGETSWRDLIRANPMLPEGPVLPRFWRQNLFIHEAPGA